MTAFFLIKDGQRTEVPAEDLIMEQECACGGTLTISLTRIAGQVWKHDACGGS